MTFDLPAAVPELPVTNLREATAYFQDSLGFSVDWTDADLGLAGLSSGNCRVFLANPDYRRARGNAGPVLVWLNVNSKQEVDQLYRLWSGRNANLISKPESKPYGLHEFTARDLDGNHLRVFYDFGTAEREGAA